MPCFLSFFMSTFFFTHSLVRLMHEKTWPFLRKGHEVGENYLCCTVNPACQKILPNNTQCIHQAVLTKSPYVTSWFLDQMSSMSAIVDRGIKIQPFLRKSPDILQSCIFHIHFMEHLIWNLFPPRGFQSVLFFNAPLPLLFCHHEGGFVMAAFGILFQCPPPQHLFLLFICT